mgnify:CR=1 FL=1
MRPPSVAVAGCAARGHDDFAFLCIDSKTGTVCVCYICTAVNLNIALVCIDTMYMIGTCRQIAADCYAIFPAGIQCHAVTAGQIRVAANGDAAAKGFNTKVF